MTILIYIVALFAASCVVTAIGMTGTSLGAIPYVAVYAVAIYAARKLCAKINKRKEEKSDGDVEKE